MAAFSSADQLRRRPAPVNTSMRRARSGIAVSSEIDVCRSSKSAPNFTPHAWLRKALPRRRLQTNGKNARTLLANSPDWLKAAPMRENLLASWRQSGQKQDPCPSLLNHNTKYKRLLPPCCDFANGVRPFR